MQDSVWHSVVMSFRLSAVTVPKTFLVCDDLDSFQEDWSGIL